MTSNHYNKKIYHKNKDTIMIKKKKKLWIIIRKNGVKNKEIGKNILQVTAIL